MPPVEDVFARLRYMREGNRNNDVANDSKEDSKGLELLNHYFFGFLLFILYLYKYIYTLFNIFCFLFFFIFFFLFFCLPCIKPSQVHEIGKRVWKYPTKVV